MDIQILKYVNMQNLDVGVDDCDEKATEVTGEDGECQGVDGLQVLKVKNTYLHMYIYPYMQSYKYAYVHVTVSVSVWCG